MSTHTTTDTLGHLRAAPLFSHLDEGQLAKLAALARAVRLPAASTLFLQGDPAISFYLLAEGRLKVYKLLRDGRTATLRHVEAHQTFAETALFRDTYPSSTEALADCLLYSFDAQRLLRLLLAEPPLAVSLLAAMAQLLGLLNRRVEELLLPVSARLARYLLALADEQLDRPAGAAGPAGAVGPAGAAAPAQPPRAGAAAPAAPPRVVRLPTSKRELAARLGTVPETLSRTLDRFKRAEVIRLSGGHELIEILDFDKLHNLAQQ
jgi:CRP/FNR family transcriptional regulator, dissimilatory nitrate respiration regulator